MRQRAESEWVEDAALSAEIRRDFMLNEKSFAVNRYCRIDLTTDQSYAAGQHGGRYAFPSSVDQSKAFIDKCGWNEMNRRARMLAQLAMTNRVAKVIDKLAMDATEIGRDGIAAVIAAMPTSAGSACFIANPIATESLSQLNPGTRLEIESSVRVTGGTATYMIPDGHVFLVWKSLTPSGLSAISYAPDAFRVDIAPGSEPPAGADLATQMEHYAGICVVDHFLPRVNGHCYQFRI